MSVRHDTSLDRDYSGVVLFRSVVKLRLFIQNFGCCNDEIVCSEFGA